MRNGSTINIFSILNPLVTNTKHTIKEGTNSRRPSRRALLLLFLMENSRGKVQSSSPRIDRIADPRNSSVLPQESSNTPSLLPSQVGRLVISTIIPHACRKSILGASALHGCRLTKGSGSPLAYRFPRRTSICRASSCSSIDS